MAPRSTQVPASTTLRRIMTPQRHILDHDKLTPRVVQHCSLRVMPCSTSSTSFGIPTNVPAPWSKSMCVRCTKLNGSLMSRARCFRSVDECSNLPRKPSLLFFGFNDGGAGLVSMRIVGGADGSEIERGRWGRGRRRGGRGCTSSRRGISKMSWRQTAHRWSLRSHSSMHVRCNEHPSDRRTV
ncbi:hypothetical protein BKA93DRAFT_62774 [Sparassis latifolia]